MAAGFIDKFSDAAEDYRRSRPTIRGSLFRALAAVTPGHGLAWDCGTGNGQAALGLARHFAAVHATDPSPQQIAQAQPAERVTYRIERAESVSLPDASADLVLAAQIGIIWAFHAIAVANIVRDSHPVLAGPALAGLAASLAVRLLPERSGHAGLVGTALRA